MTGNESTRATTTIPSEDPIEALLQPLRHSGQPLNDQLDCVSRAIAQSDPDYARAYDLLVDRLRSAHLGECAPKQGEEMPDFLLPDEGGRLVSLASLRREGPVVVAFVRGHWCPYCRLATAAMASIAAEIKPAQIVVITPEIGKFAKGLRDDSGAQFPFLTDFGNGYSLMLGLAFVLDEHLSAMLRADACDIPAFQGAVGWVLPVPAVFVVGRDGNIKERYVNPDFRQRMEIDALRYAALAALASDG